MASKAAELEMDINEHRYMMNILHVHRAYILNCRTAVYIYQLSSSVII